MIGSIVRVQTPTDSAMLIKSEMAPGETTEFTIDMVYAPQSTVPEISYGKSVTACVIGAGCARCVTVR